MDDNNSNHVTTRVDLGLKRDGLQYATDAERTPSWVWAKAIELGLPEVMRLYPPKLKSKKRKPEEVAA